MPNVRVVFGIVGSCVPYRRDMQSKMGVSLAEVLQNTKNKNCNPSFHGNWNRSLALESNHTYKTRHNDQMRVTEAWLGRTYNRQQKWKMDKEAFKIFII